MRSAGCIVNDWADRHWDRHVVRTKDRPLTTGCISEKTALLWFLMLVGLSAALLLPLNLKVLGLACAALASAIIYPFMKRYTHLPQAVLGLTFSWAIPMAFAAQNASLDIRSFLLMAAVVTWVMAYDTQYAMVDRKDDKKVGIKSTAILFGYWDRVWVVVFQTSMLGLAFCLGLVARLRLTYFLALAVMLLLFIYQFFLIYYRVPENCFKAFLNNHYVGLTWFLGVTLGIS